MDGQRVPGGGLRAQLRLALVVMRLRLWLRLRLRLQVGRILLLLVAYWVVCSVRRRLGCAARLGGCVRAQLRGAIRGPRVGAIE